MRIFRFMAATVAMLALAGCSKPPVVNQFTKADVESITKAVQDVRAAYNAKDADKVAALFAPDAVLMPPNQATARSRDSVKQYYVARFAEGASDLEIVAKDIAGDGALAYASGDFRLVLNAPTGGEPQRDRGKFVWVFRKLDGRWMIEYVIFSSDFAPRPAPASAT